jgi:hypothetical protein
LTKSRSITCLKVTLEEVEPKVVRRLEAPLKIRLDRLHLVLQAAMGWTNSYLFEFRVGDVGWGVPDPDFGDGPLPATQATLLDVVEDTGARTIRYVYDFGDDWEHTAQVESVAAAEPDARYPRLLKARGACPPEDVGGVWGYAACIEARADPQHERHREILEWFDPDFDPTKVDEDAIQRRLEGLARPQRPAKPAKRGARAA